LGVTLLQQQYELIATYSGHRVFLPDAIFQSCADILEELVPRIVTQAIVDELEAVHIESHNDERVIAAMRAGQRLFEASFQKMSVREARQ
jgi:hypothetical protein